MNPKFRAWGHLAGEEYRMFYDIHIFDEYMVPWADEDNPILDHTLLQYTGFKDKDGAEIYHHHVIPGSDGKCGEVIWYNGWYLETPAGFGLVNLMDVADRYAVAGNRFEHPELLESKQ